MAVPGLVHEVASSATHSSGTFSRQLTLPTLLAGIVTELWLALLALGSLLAKPPSPNYFATASVLLCLAAALQGRGIWQIAAGRGTSVPLPMRRSLRLVLVNGCIAYGIGLALGPAAGVSMVVAGCFALLGSITLLPLAATPVVLDQWRRLVAARRPRRVGLAVYHALLAWVAVEALLQGVRVLERSEWFSTAAAGEPAAVAARVPRASARPGVLRVAILEDLTAVVAPGSASCAAELAQVPSGVELRRLSLAGSDPDAWRDELAAFHPDIVLGLVSLEQGLKPPQAAFDPLDWRSLETLRLAAHVIAGGSPLDVQPGFADAADGSSAGDVRRLSLCRTPLDEPVKAQWRATFAHLDRLVAGCAAIDTRLALVVVPDGFQVNRVLCETLRRRAGYQASQLDLDLPQRRLAAYAEDRGLMLVDLLPYLRASRGPVFHQASGGWNAEARQVASRAVSGWLHSQYGGLAATAQLSRGR